MEISYTSLGVVTWDYGLGTQVLELHIEERETMSTKKKWFLEKYSNNENPYEVCNKLV